MPAPPPGPRRDAELAAERLLLAAALLLRNTTRKRPIRAKHHLAVMLRQIPTIAKVLGVDAGLEQQARALADAYQTGSKEAAAEANQWIEAYLFGLCH